MDKRPFSGSSRPRAWNLIGLISTFAVTLAHIALVWRHTGFWGDAGRWRHEVVRYIHGEILYRDFVWPYPPFALWSMGWIGRLFGDSTTVFFVAAAMISVALAGAYFACCSALLKDRWTIAIVAPIGVLLAFSYAQIGGDPLPSGSYTPAAPLGALFLLAGLIAGLSEHGTIAGIACGLAIVTKQDFWLPAAAVLVMIAMKHRPSARNAWLGAAAVVITVTALVVAQSGWHTLVLIATGYGRAGLQRIRPMPSWERITAETTGLTLLLGLFLAALQKWRPALITFAICASAAAFLFINAANFGDFRRIVLLHQFPIALSIIGLIWSLRTKDTGLGWFFLITACASMRRGFERTDWACLPLELAAYVLILHRQKLDRVIPLLATASLLVALGTYWQFGVGPLTAQHANRVWVKTAKGLVNWPEDEAKLYYRLRSELGADRSPLMAFLYTGGFNYYLDRANPSPSDEGLLFSGRDPNRDIMRIRAARPMLLYTGYYGRVNVNAGPRFTSWRFPAIPDPRVAREHILFQTLVEGCQPSLLGQTRPEFWIYRCSLAR